MAKGMIRMLKLGLTVLVIGCASSELPTEKDSNRNDASSITVTDSSLTLADYLRKVAGVDVRGTGGNIRVYIRGINTISGRNEPLFVVDGSRLGRSYQRVNSLVAVDDIDKIRVLKGGDAGARYGLEGSAGAIEIKTKRD